MRISTAPDKSLIIQTEKIEIGKGNHTSLSIRQEIAPFLSFLFLGVLVFVQGTFRYQLFTYIVVVFFGFTYILIAIHNIFFKIGGLKPSQEYQICPNGYLSFYPQDATTATMVNNINIIKSIDIIVTVNEDTNPSGDEIFWPSKTLYQVIVELNSGESNAIEENCIEIVSSDANQIAFRELIAETYSSVKQIKLFLAESSLS